MKIHILRPDSLTPIALYLERQRNGPDSYDAQLDFAAVLLYREREYRAKNMSSWYSGSKPAPSPDSPFQPFDITAEAAADLAATLAGDALPIDRDDLFGLKDAAVDGLQRVLRPVKAHRMGWLVSARLLTDVCRYRDAVSAADQAVALGEAVQGKALASHAALLGGIRRKHERSDRTLNRTVDAFQERLRQLALRVRTRVEGDAFTRFLSTETAFCEQERTAALESFDASRVPAALHDLIPLAREIGVGDDVCRGKFISRMRAADRREAARQIRAHGQAIDDWLASLPKPHVGEAEAFFWLQAAADDLDTA